MTVYFTVAFLSQIQLVSECCSMFLCGGLHWVSQLLSQRRAFQPLHLTSGQPVVIRVTADPHPDEVIAVLSGQRAV